MNLKKILLSFCGLFSAALVFSAGNETGIEYYRAELYDAAKIYFNNRIPTIQGEELAEAYYYLGESYLATENPDSAALFYQKAIQADPEYPYAYIGESRLALKKGDRQAVKDLLKKATGLAKKDPAIHTAVAEAYINANEYEEANESLEKARKIKKNFSGIYVAEGDLMMAQGKVGDAAAKYETAIMFDKTDKVAYLKEARVYKSINPQLSLEILDRLLEVDPNYIAAYAEVGEINYNTGFYGKAIDAYAKFIEIPGVPLKHQINYASLLYFTKEYAKSLDEIKRILAQDPNNVVMHRLQAYNNYELGNYEVGLQEIDKFFALIPKEQTIALDYIYYGRLLDKNKQPDQAIDAFKKALELDDSKVEIYKEIAIAYGKNYDEAINYYKLYFEKDPEAPLIDLFNYGVACYSAANQTDDAGEMTLDSVKRKEYLLEADKIFEQVVERSPTSYLGYLWRGHSNSGMDLDASQGLAKPYYEKALEIMLENNPDGRRNKDIIDIYRYLGFYYYVREDKTNAKLNFSKILEIDPENQIAKDVLDQLK